MISLSDLDIAAKTVWGEARSEGDLGMLAVACVIVNRAKRKAGRLADVCLKPFQFSCWNDNDPNRPLLDDLTLNDSSFQLAMLAALQVIQGLSFPCGVGTETHYYRAGSPVPHWAVGKQKSFAIGRHIFFSNID